MPWYYDCTYKAQIKRTVNVRYFVNTQFGFILPYSSVEPRNSNTKYFNTVKGVFNVTLGIMETRFSP